jgi:hypothetical protein
VPGAIGAGLVERQADAGRAAPGGELGGDDARVVGDEQVAGLEQRRQVGDAAVLEGGADMEQTRGVARPGGGVSDPVGGKVEVELGEVQGAGFVIA